MYELFRHKKVMPSDYFFRKSGEKTIIRAFFEQEVKDHNEEINS